MYVCSDGSRSLAKEMRALKMSVVAGQRKIFHVLNEKLRAVIEVDPFKTTWEVAKELEDKHSVVFWHLKWIGKVKRLSKWVPHELTVKKKKSSFWGVFSYSVQNKQTNKKISWSNYEVLWQVDFMQLMMTSSVFRPRRSSKALPKSKLAPK